MNWCNSVWFEFLHYWVFLFLKIVGNLLIPMFAYKHHAQLPFPFVFSTQKLEHFFSISQDWLVVIILVLASHEAEPMTKTSVQVIYLGDYPREWQSTDCYSWAIIKTRWKRWCKNVLQRWSELVEERPCSEQYLLNNTGNFSSNCLPRKWQGQECIVSCEPLMRIACEAINFSVLFS